MKSARRCTRTFGIRLDEDTFQTLRQLAVETDRTMASVVRMLIRLAAGGDVIDIDSLLQGDRGPHAGEEVAP